MKRLIRLTCLVATFGAGAQTEMLDATGIESGMVFTFDITGISTTSE